MMSNAAFRELGSDLGKQLIHFATSNNIHVERVKFEVEKNKPPHWFDINKFSLPKSSVQYALDVTEIVRAQQAQKNFVQTLTKTFATLSIGLAIFDRNRQLMLFNPALIDLTTLPADFLSARPNLLTVFDKLRDNQIMPEPKIMRPGGKSLPFWSRQRPREPTPKFGIYPLVQHFGFQGVRTQLAHWRFCLKI